LREAIIIGSVLAKNSIPVLHSSGKRELTAQKFSLFHYLLYLILAVMLKIAEMEYSGANSIFLRVFFDKKYALPYRVIDAVVFHFLK